MTWEELVDKAIEMGYEDYFDFMGMKAIWNIKGLSFHSTGRVCYGFILFAENRTYEQMYQIMEALR